MSTLTETGYALPYGVITGQITYDGRQGVPGVLVTAITEDEVPVPKRLVKDSVVNIETHHFRTLMPTGCNRIQGPMYVGDNGSVMFWLRVSKNDMRNWTRLFCLPYRLDVCLSREGYAYAQGSSREDRVSTEHLALNEWHHIAVCYTKGFYIFYPAHLAILAAIFILPYYFR
jgi:hypothetical protein